MIYLDNAATSFPKPRSVIEAMAKFFDEGASPGRGTYSMAVNASRMVFETREDLARLFNVSDSRNIIFTANGTEAINLALKGFLRPGDGVITTSVEHNSVTRPLKALEEHGVRTTKVSCGRDGSLDPARVDQEIRPDTRLIVMTHASNVAGTILPLKEVGAVAKRRGVTFMVDGAQTAGLLPLDVKEANIGLLAFPGHKALMGPPGTAGLYIAPDVDVKELKEGGTGEDSGSPLQPRGRPERYECGTLNSIGIAGLQAALRFIEAESIGKIWEKEKLLTQRLIAGLHAIDGVRVYGPTGIDERVPIISFNVAGKTGEEVAFLLDRKFDIAARSGLHCAPDAHRTQGTLRTGTVRFSVGFYNTNEDIDKAIEAVQRICEKTGKKHELSANPGRNHGQ